MKAAVSVALAAVVAAVCVGAATAADGPRIVQAGGATYPDQAWILTLPKPQSIQRTSLQVSENGGPVANLGLVKQGTVASGTQVVLAIDASASMAGKPFEDALAAARAFARHMNPEEQVAIVTFNEDVDVIQGFTTDQSKVLKALSKQPKLHVQTKINDALDKSVSLFDPNIASANIVVLSDGTDHGSNVTRKTVLSELAQHHVRVFSVGLVSDQFDAPGLQQLAAETRGTFVTASKPSQLTPIFDGLGRQLASEYLVKYRSRQNPKTHVDVKIAVKGVPGVAVASYTTPPLHLEPLGVYHPALVDRVVQSRWTMLVVALLIAVLVGWAISHATRRRDDPLVERVSGFVSVQRQGRQERAPRTQEERITRSLINRMAQGTQRSRRLSERMANALELADVNLEPVQLLAFTALGTVIVIGIFVLLIGPIGVILGLATPLVVRLWVLRRIARKRAAFAEQLPDNLDVLASALRAGHSHVSALSVVADDAVEPAKSEFRRVIAEEQFGVQLEDAFKVVVERMDNKELDQVALVARLQREVGSNSAEVLDRVVETVRARMELRRLIRTLTAQGRLSRWILTILPLALALAMAVIGGNYMKPLYHSTVGQILIVIAALMVTTGSWIIKRIVDIRV